MFVYLGNAPDTPLTGWGHDKYHISHSLFVTAAVVAIACLAVRLADRRRVLPARLYVAGIAAWYSHLFLDTIYNHGHGLAMFWPVSDRHLCLPIPWFSIMDTHHVLSWYNAKVWSIEGLVYGTLLGAVLLARHYYFSRRSSTTSPQP